MENISKSNCMEILSKNDLLLVSGGGAWWEWLGETIGNIQNLVEDAWESWKNNSETAIKSMPY